ncbi:MAG: DNA polymerase III subunit delta [Planctomycetota bacterium]
MAAPHPDKELDRLQKLCRQGLPKVLVLSGTGAWFRTRAVELALAAVPADAELVTVDGQLTEIRGLRAADDDDGDDGEGEDEGGGAAAPAQHCPDLQPLAGGGLFARTAFVVVRRAERWLRRYSGALAAFLPRIAPGSGLVLEAQKLDKRTKFAKELQQHGAVFELRELYETPFGRPDRPLEGELVQWVATQGRRLGVALSPEAALLLTAELGKDPGELLAELQQLKDRLGADPKRPPLQPEQLRSDLGSGFESTPFELAEAVLGMDRRRALRSLRAMFARGVRQRDGKRMDQGGLFPFATSWMFQSMGSVLEGRQLLDDGVPLRDVAGRVGVRGFTERYEEQVRRNERGRLEHGLRALLACQRERRLSGEDDDVLLERFLARWFDGLVVPSPEEFEW